MIRLFPSFNTRLVICLLLVCTIIGIPAVSAVTLTPGSSATTTTISQGDPVYIRGIATGHPQAGLQIWFIGYNFVKISNVQVNSDNSYEYELAKADTANLATGQYFVLVQHPMMNGQFDVTYDSATGSVKNQISGQTLFKMTGSSSLQGTNGAAALIQAVASQNIDDTFATVSFFVSNPTVVIAPIGDKRTGNVFIINGTTSLAPGDNLQVEIVSSSYRPTTKNQPSGFSGASGMVKVVAGSGGKNTWSFDVDTSSFTPDEYIVKVSGVEQAATASTTFNVLCAGSGDTCGLPAITTPATTTAAMVTVNQTVSLAPETTAQPTQTTVPATTQQAPLPVVIGLAAMVLAFAIFRK
jgi:trimeric autotransporter adhesin